MTGFQHADGRDGPRSFVMMKLEQYYSPAIVGEAPVMRESKGESCLGCLVKPSVGLGFQQALVGPVYCLMSVLS